MTGTYKLQKTELQKEGFDVTRIQDPVYFMGPKVGERTTNHPLSQDQTYRLLDRDSYLALVANLQTAKL